MRRRRRHAGDFVEAAAAVGSLGPALLHSPAVACARASLLARAGDAAAALAVCDAATAHWTDAGGAPSAAARIARFRGDLRLAAGDHAAAAAEYRSALGAGGALGASDAAAVRAALVLAWYGLRARARTRTRT